MTDHSHMMGMDMGSPTASAAAPASTAMSGMDHGGMDMGGGSGSAHACKISMLWNWNTVDTCFISSTWQNTSKGMFAGSCIGVIFLVLALEFLRRAGKEYDGYIIKQHARSLAGTSADRDSSSDPANKKLANATACAVAPQQKFRPNVFQQAIRALLHMLQFAVAYFIMLLAMYYNGYILICIFIGAYIGYFIFGWEALNVRQGGRDRLQEEVTVCCG